MAGRIAERASVGLVVAAAGIILLVVAFDLSSVASIGSAVALTIFALVTVGHLRVRADTGARVSILVLALLTTGITLATFVVTTLVHEPASIATLIGILVISILLDVFTTRSRNPEAGAAAAGG